MASQPAGGKKKPPLGATTRGRARTAPGGETQRTPGPGTIELSGAMQTSLTGDAARRGNTPAPHFDRPPETRMMTPGTLSLAGNSPSDDERSKTVGDITPLPMSFAQLSRTSPRPEGVTFRNQPRPNTPADLFSAASQGQTSTTRTTDSSTWVQPVGATGITLEDVQSQCRFSPPDSSNSPLRIVSTTCKQTYWALQRNSVTIRPTLYKVYEKPYDERWSRQHNSKNNSYVTKATPLQNCRGCSAKRSYQC
jgi:hypothetical protein